MAVTEASPPAQPSTSPARPVPGRQATGAPETDAPDGRGPNATQLGTLLMLVADAMVLAALLAAYFTIKDGAPLWPPGGVSLGTYLPTVVTVTAVMSAVSAYWALYAIQGDDQRSSIIGIAFTVALGLAMVNAQWFSLDRAGFGVQSHNYGTLYYLLIGYHLAHLVAGIAALLVVGARVLVGHFDAENHGPLRAAVTLWQYSNVAWFVILTTLFIFSRHA